MPSGRPTLHARLLALQLALILAISTLLPSANAQNVNHCHGYSQQSEELLLQAPASTCQQCRQACVSNPSCAFYAWGPTAAPRHVSDPSPCSERCVGIVNGQRTLLTAPTCSACSQQCSGNTACTEFSWFGGSFTAARTSAVGAGCPTCAWFARDFSSVVHQLPLTRDLSCADCQQGCASRSTVATFPTGRCIAYAWDGSNNAAPLEQACPSVSGGADGSPVQVGSGGPPASLPCVWINSGSRLEIFGATCSGCALACTETRTCSGVSWRGGAVVDPRTTRTATICAPTPSPA